MAGMLAVKQCHQHIHIEQSPHLDVFFSAKPTHIFHGRHRSPTLRKDIEPVALFHCGDVRRLARALALQAAQGGFHPLQFIGGQFSQCGFNFLQRAHARK